MLPTSRKSCFVIASGAVPVGPFFEALRREGIEPFFISDFLQSSSLSTSTLRGAFRSADIIVAFLVPGFPSENAIFEIGLAVGLGRPLMIFSSREISLPFDLKKFQVNYIDLSNFENAIPSIKKFFETKEKGYLPEKIADYSSPPEKRRPNLRGQILRNELSRIRNLANSPVEFERSIAGLLSNLGWTVAEARLDARTRAPDVAVWIDEIQKDVGNPLAIEIKTSFKPSDLERVTAQLTRYLETAGAKAGLILYSGPDLLLNSNIAQNVPPILALNFDEFADLLEQERFPAALKASFAQAKRSA
jgi:hypothetical protein